MAEIHNQKYSKSALASMYKHGQGILSPGRFGDKKKSFYLFGFAVGAFLPIVIAKSFSIAMEGWTAYFVLGSGLVTAVLGAFFMGSIFNANFVCDESLQDPLFDYLSEIDRR